jgi:NADP-dependent 3-hydroxy acid dehydrogenase YdfG
MSTADITGYNLADRLETLAKEIALDGGQALAVTVDLTDETSVQSVAERIGHAYGRVDLVVNAAGVTLPTPVEAGRTDELVVLSHELVDLTCCQVVDDGCSAGDEHL